MRLRNNPKAYEIMEENADLVILKPEEHKGHYHDIFEINQPLYIEIGMGKGDFIYQNALKHPENNYIGIEKFPSVLAAAINKINKNLSKFNLTRVQHEILCFIDKNEHEGDVFQKDIEKCLKLTNPTVTGIVKRLEEKEMIVRCPSNNDARYKCLHVTEKGKDVTCKSFKFGANNIEKQLVKDMTDEEIKILKDLLSRALKNMEE